MNAAVASSSPTRVESSPGAADTAAIEASSSAADITTTAAAAPSSTTSSSPTPAPVPSVSFASLVRAHERSQQDKRSALERRRKQCVASVEHVTATLQGSINADVARVFNRQLQLDTEAKSLQRETRRFQAQTAAWVASYKQFNDALKELGDVESWSAAINRDMHGVAQILEEVVAIGNQNLQHK